MKLTSEFVDHRYLLLASYTLGCARVCRKSRDGCCPASSAADLSRTIAAAALRDHLATHDAWTLPLILPRPKRRGISRSPGWPGIGTWCVPARDLGRKPRAFTLLGTPLVVFRTNTGGVAALLDRCPHRNVPLSLGHTNKRTGTLECAYHGWQFAPDGHCVLVPGLMTEPSKAWHVPAYPAKVQDGLVWVFGSPDVTPEANRSPFPGRSDLGVPR
jgi:nitrite reductase/ring-hydroxylating ferredoxin subunit